MALELLGCALFFIGTFSIADSLSKGRSRGIYLGIAASALGLILILAN